MTQLQDLNRTGQSTSRSRGAVTLRSIILGFAGVFFVCALTPYNDLAIAEAPFIGNYFPVGMLLYFLVILFAVNAPLHRWLPQLAMNGGELAIAFGMVLVSCAIPGNGLMRLLPSILVGIQAQAGNDSASFDVLHHLHLAQWLFPTFQSADPRLHVTEEVISNYGNHSMPEGASLIDRWRAVPWSAWRAPAIAWGIFFAALYGAVLCISVLVRRQWSETERLPFPLAGVFGSLIEEPQPGRAVNELFHSRLMWFGAGGVLAIHLLNGLHEYAPRTVPGFPIGYNLTGILANPPWTYTDYLFKHATLYFSIVGITYFIQSRIAFSLWAFYVLRQLMNLFNGAQGITMAPTALSDQVLGALVAYGGMILWIGRGHLAMIGRQMFFRRRPQDFDEPYLPYFLAAWGLLACAGIATGWLTAAGMSIYGAIVLVVSILLVVLVMARVIAETGLIFATIGANVNRTWGIGANLFERISTTQSSFFLGSLLNYITVVGLRETLSVYSTHALRVDDAAPIPGRQRRWVIPLLAASLALGYVTAGASTLLVEYNHAMTLAHNPGPLNSSVFGNSAPLLSDAGKYTAPFAAFRQRFGSGTRPVGNVAIGIGITTALAAMRLRFAWWPLHPVGYLLWQSYPLAAAWFSLFVGWLVKVVLVRFGGAKFYQQARPFFIGLIFGEAAAAAIWLAVALIAAAFGADFHSVFILPQ